MIFRPTDSIITNLDNKYHPTTFKSSRQKGVNLLTILQNRNQFDYQNDDIQTFEEFKEYVNKYDFQKNQHSQPRTSAMIKPKYTLPQSTSGGLDANNQKNTYNIDIGGNKTNFFNRRVQSMDQAFSGLGVEQKDSGELGGFLGIVKEQLHSRASTKRNTIQQKYNLTTGLDLAYEVNQQDKLKSKEGNSNEDWLQNASIYKSSAHSSRSFNGYQQINQYEVRQKLGAGSFSTVHLCIDIHTKKKYAMKVVKKKQMQKKLFRKNSLVLADIFISNEIAILKKMEHPYIIRLYEVIEDDTKKQIYMILQYCDGGFINQIKSNDQKNIAAQQKYKKLLESQCKRYFKQLSLAIDYIHNIAKIAHRDIKPENILLSQKDQIKISDFGLGTEDLEVSSKSGTMGYLPPEARDKSLISNANPNSKLIAQMADIWALGITLLVLLHGKNIEIEDSKLQSYINNMKDISSSCKDLLQKCLKLKYEQRITASQLIDHPWVQAKKPQNYNQIQISKQQQEQAIIRRNRDILTQIARLHLS